MNNKTSGIYKICNGVNGKAYVGQSVDLKRRKGQHMYYLQLNTHCNPHLQNAWNKYGASAFIFVIIERCPVEKLNERENFWIEELNSYTEGYNLDITAQGTGPRAVETKEKIRNKLMGHTHSEETKEKISRSKLGQKYGPCSEGRKIKISEAKKGKYFSEEHKAKLSEAKKGKPGNRLGSKVSEESKEKMRRAKLGKPSSREGVKYSEEAKAEMREVRRRRKEARLNLTRPE